MKLDESQNATDNTSFSDDQLSDQSVRTSQNFARNSRTQKTSTEACNSTRNHRFFHGKPNEPKNSKLHRTKLAQAAENFTSPNKTSNERWKT